MQQTLLRDDCYLPLHENTDPLDLARGGKVTASSQQADYPAADILSGVTRRVEGVHNEWRSDGLSENGEWVRLDLRGLQNSPVR